MKYIKKFEDYSDDNWEPKIGERYWFEYHCNESPDSADYQMYLHSHQKCLILSISEQGIGDTMKDRLDDGCPRLYKVQFDDGFVWDAFEDEIMDDPKYFCRPDPPKK